ncbi:MAG: DUF362 domain-containing protein [Opitutales bacterium]|nr:DUF362 domain-containing protein [Opitutales bacterium]
MLLAAILCASPLKAAFWLDNEERSLFLNMVYAHAMPEFSAERYEEAVRWVLGSFEVRTGKKLAPGEKRLVGLKVYTNSGEGLETPHNLVRAVIKQLQVRGYTKDEIFILDVGQQFLRDSGYLPALSQRGSKPNFEGVRVRTLDEEGMIDKAWFYENPLPVDYTTELGRQMMQDRDAAKDEELRRSYLPAPLVKDVDFWINLPVVVDSPAMEISGSMANATLWNTSNRNRFFNSPANAPVAMAEIAAIPELMDNWALTILSLERYQFIGGPVFNSNYVRSDPILLASTDPAILDAWCGRRMNAYRKLTGFDLINNPPFAVSFARMVGVGGSNSDAILWITPQGANLDPILSYPDRVTEQAPPKQKAQLFWSVQ